MVRLFGLIRNFDINNKERFDSLERRVVNVEKRMK